MSAVQCGMYMDSPRMPSYITAVQFLTRPFISYFNSYLQRSPFAFDWARRSSGLVGRKKSSSLRSGIFFRQALQVADNNLIEYLHFFGIKYPFIEIDGMKIASDELEYAIRNHPNSPEGFELMEEIDGFLPEKELLRQDEKTVRMYMST